jgi:hypothetical protein
MTFLDISGFHVDERQGGSGGDSMIGPMRRVEPRGPMNPEGWETCKVGVYVDMLAMPECNAGVY